MFWQVCGFCFPIAGLLVFILSFILCKEPEPFDHDVDAAFDEDDRAGVGAESSMAAAFNTGGVNAAVAPINDGVAKENELAKIEQQN